MSFLKKMGRRRQVTGRLKGRPWQVVVMWNALGTNKIGVNVKRLVGDGLIENIDDKEDKRGLCMNF